jgi:hypothetical protein
MTQDNRPIKDGAGDIFTLRMRDISPAGDGTIMRSMIMSTPYPNDYMTGGAPGGIFSHCAISGNMTAALPINSPIYSFQWTAASLAAIRRVRLTAWATVTAFAANGVAAFDIYQARSFAAPDGGGTPADLTGNHAKRRVATTPPSIQMVILSTTLFEKPMGEHPLLLAASEGFVIHASMPVVGTWQFAVTTEWDEIPGY